MELRDKVVLVTGGANGIGRASAERFARAGAHVLVADVDARAGAEVAGAVGGAFVACDVTDLDSCTAAVAAAEERFGGLDVAFLNAGVALGSDLGEGFDLLAYRRAMSVNIDGVVFGVHAALPALKRRGGAIVATASLAGLTAAPADPVYCANKHAVVGLVRALGPVLAKDGVRVNAVCPGYAETAIIGPIEGMIAAAGIPLLTPDDVAAAVEAILAGEGTGEAWFVQPGRAPAPFAFRNVPGPRDADGGRVGGVPETP
ncbi:SDR family NAD(P)-dependent oxidoreductase [Spongisporangium articulatum]|uniref:SDR family NAD(P)-dependent oxidoreductase n=1 Tax=Spongisporangium articulatum TaxID=3362603 RepID=A0ABW8AQV4_9ACTN